MVVQFRARVGRVRTPTSDTSSRGDFERQVRAQFKDVMKELQRWIEHMEVESAAVLEEALRPTFEKSQMYVPEDTGLLKSSGYLETTQTSQGARVEIGYSRNGIAAYGVFVHEIVEYEHEPPTRAKFLQAALEEDNDDIQDRIVEGMRKASGVDSR